MRPVEPVRLVLFTGWYPQSGGGFLSFSLRNQTHQTQNRVHIQKNHTKPHSKHIVSRSAQWCCPKDQPNKDMATPSKNRHTQEKPLVGFCCAASRALVPLMPCDKWPTWTPAKRCAVCLSRRAPPFFRPALRPWTQVPNSRAR